MRERNEELEAEANKLHTRKNMLFAPRSELERSVAACFYQWMK